MQMKNSPSLFLWCFIVVTWIHVQPTAPTSTIFDWLLALNPFQSSMQYENNFTICNTEICKRAAKIILDGVNKDVDPCDDFYEFACGLWPLSNPIPTDHIEWSRFTQSAKEIKDRLLEILESEQDINVTRPERLMKTFYKDCMDLDSQEIAALESIHNMTREMGGWPIFIDINSSWQKVDRYYTQLTGSNSLFQINVVPDYLTRKSHKIQVSPGTFPQVEAFPLSSRWRDWPEKKTPYTTFVEKVARIFLDDQNISFTEKEFNENIFNMLEFEHKLYQATDETSHETVNAFITTIEQLQFHYFPISIYKLNNNTANIDWLQNIKDIFDSWNYTIDENENVITPSLHYFPQLALVLNSTDNKVIVNYIHWKFVSTMIPFTTRQMRSVFVNVFGQNYSETNEKRRFDCLIECRLHHVLYREYARKYFSNNVKLDILEMSRSIQNQALEMIKRSHWLDYDTQSSIIEKINDIHMMIGYPDWYDDNTTAMIKFYEKLKRGGTHLKNTLNNMKFVNDKNLELFHQQMNKYEWQLRPIDVNAIYMYYFNALLLPMAYAGSPLYSTDLFNAIKYGLLGSTIGHEIFHALDPHGIKYDGNWNELVWHENTIEIYEERVNCVVNQLNHYRFIEKDAETGQLIIIQANGTLSMKEDMADVAGLRAVFNAYQVHVDHGDQRLVGLEEFDHNKLFFISFATKWCHAARVQWWSDNYGSSGYYETHSPSRVRVNNVLRNFEQFANTFKCPIGTPMNHKIKCIIFDDFF